MNSNLTSHNLIDIDFKEIIYENRPCLNVHGKPAEGLYNAWIILNNPSQYNSYTTQAVKEVILAFRKASNDRSVVAVVFTAVGDKAFCTGGIRKNMQSIMQEIRRNTSSICVCLMIWYLLF